MKFKSCFADMLMFILPNLNKIDTLKMLILTISILVFLSPSVYKSHRLKNPKTIII